MRKHKWKRQSIAAALLLTSATVAHAAFVLNFDENGNGSYQIFNQSTGAYGPLVADPGAVVVDATSPTGFALQYRVPEFVVPGGVGVQDTPGILSDALVFLDD